MAGRRDVAEDAVTAETDEEDEFVLVGRPFMPRVSHMQAMWQHCRAWWVYMHHEITEIAETMVLVARQSPHQAPWYANF